MSLRSEALAPGAVPLARDARIVGLVAFAHAVSHFFHLIVAPLFPWIRAEFGYSYAELGFVMTVFFVVSGAGQALAGFVVDRFGALGTLVAGLGCLSAGAVTFGLSGSYGGLLAGAVLTGLGNAVFHPVDFWLINHRVSVGRLGPAYSAHGLSGSLGWAAAPVFLVGIATPFGWRTAVLAAAWLPLVVIALVVLQRAVLGATGDADAPAPVRPAASGAAPAPVLAFMRAPALWWCFAFFVFVALALGTIQTFAPIVFAGSYGLTVTAAALSVTVYMLASAAGMLAGGWLVMKRQRLEANIALALTLAGVAAVLVGLGILPGAVALALMAVMGFGSGLSGPSRDMLIRSAAPPGATGRVYGVVYSGLDVGIAIAPLAFGGLLDRGYYAAVFFGIGAAFFAGLLAANRVAARSPGLQPAVKPGP